MENKLRTFITDWNRENSSRGIVFIVDFIPGIELPARVGVRYPSVKYKSLYTRENWLKLNKEIEDRSYGNIYITSNEDVFERGIIEMAIASKNHNFREMYVANTINWIGLDFFRSSSTSTA